MAEADRPDEKIGANALVVRPAGRLENLTARVLPVSSHLSRLYLFH